MLYPKLVGQSGTAKPTPLLVTIPPLQIKKRVAIAVNKANRNSHSLVGPAVVLGSVGLGCLDATTKQNVLNNPVF
jgi:hypothetical protein